MSDLNLCEKRKSGGIGVLFAGQGSQKTGMGKDLYETFPEFKKVFDLLPEKQRRIAFEGPEEALKDTVNAQPVLLAFGVGVYRVLESMGLSPNLAAGLSLGEYSALTASGVFADKEALELIQFRADCMAKASEGIDTVMSAVLGLDREAVLSVCKKASAMGTVEAANYNCPGQIVLSGSEQGVSEAERLAKEAGAKRTMRLPVSGPFHTSYMKSVGDELRDKFKTVNFGEMNFPVIFNCIGRAKNVDEDIEDLLARQVYSSVYFDDSIRYIRECGIEKIIEIGPGKALSGFVKKTCREIEVITVENVEDIGKAEQWIEKWR